MSSHPFLDLVLLLQARPPRLPFLPHHGCCWGLPVAKNVRSPAVSRGGWVNTAAAKHQKQAAAATPLSVRGVENERPTKTFYTASHTAIQVGRQLIPQIIPSLVSLLTSQTTWSCVVWLLLTPSQQMRRNYTPGHFIPNADPLFFSFFFFLHRHSDPQQ